MNYIHLESTGSTNDYAREIAANAVLPALITADTQTAGRGRQGKSFYSPAGTGLYMTLLFESPEQFSDITPAAAVAVCESIYSLTGTETLIKWVNDIYLGSKKICGILTERFEKDGRYYIALGIGINLTTEGFPPELTQAGALGKDIDKEKAAYDIAGRFFELINSGNKIKLITEYEKRLKNIGKTVTYSINSVSYCGTATGIDSDYGLIVMRRDGTQDILKSGEVSIKEIDAI